MNLVDHDEMILRNTFHCAVTHIWITFPCCRKANHCAYLLQKRVCAAHHRSYPATTYTFPSGDKWLLSPAAVWLLFYDKLRWLPYSKLWEALFLFLSEAHSHLFLDLVCITFMMILAGYVRRLVIVLFLNGVQLSRIRAYHRHEQTLSLFPFSYAEKLY